MARRRKNRFQKAWDSIARKLSWRYKSVLHRYQELRKKWTFNSDFKRLDPTLQTFEGRRFFELEGLIRDFLLSRLSEYPEHARTVASQLINVLRNCDTISYQEAGTGDAYVLLHFLDRFHRFQLTFAMLKKCNLMPMPDRQISILDIGTGPGPSMFAVSDFYTAEFRLTPSDYWDWPKKIVIDYVERSEQFRNWLHHFTERANRGMSPTLKWYVPFHHGTHPEFKNMDFGQRAWGRAAMGRINSYRHLERYDLVIFSNFLTKDSQIEEFRKEIENCARYLRHNGILIVVGAKATSIKYNTLYSKLANIITRGRYIHCGFEAKCVEAKLPSNILGYRWDDAYGLRLKAVLKEAYVILSSTGALTPEVEKVFRKTLSPDFRKPVEWEAHVFRKIAVPRSRRIRCSHPKASGHLVEPQSQRSRRPRTYIRWRPKKRIAEHLTHVYMSVASRNQRYMLHRTASSRRASSCSIPPRAETRSCQL